MINHGEPMSTSDTETQSVIVDEYPDADCPLCECGAAIRIPASSVGALYDFILCYGCGRVSIVEPGAF